MPTFHTLEEALKKFNEKFYSIPDKTCLWHRNVDLRQFLSLVWQSAQEVRNRELAEKVEKEIEFWNKHSAGNYKDGAVEALNNLINK
jgi:hypothetical protein